MAFITSLAVDDIMSVGDLNDQQYIGNYNNLHSNDNQSLHIKATLSPLNFGR